MYKKFKRNIYSGERSRTTSWQRVAPWYNRVTNQGQGHYYHEKVIIPNTLRLLNLQSDSKLLDLGCGNGVLAKSLPKEVEYLGVDMSESLVILAKNADKSLLHKHLVADATRPLTIPVDFTDIALILSLQNMQNPAAVIANCRKHLTIGGKLVIVINHPMFRIPRQTSWGTDERRKIQYRRIDRYLSPMSIPINMNPSDKNSQKTVSYHYPLSSYSKMLKESGFVIELIEEWASDKESEGRAAKMENRSRSEIPLFMAIVAVKK